MEPAGKNMQLTGAGNLHVTKDRLENNVEYDASGKTEASFHVINVEAVPVEPLNRETNQAEGMTLLEKALAYREQNPEKWHQRQEDNERRVNESYGIYEQDRFLDEYYKRLAELKIEEMKLAERRKLEKPRISFQLQFNNPRVAPSAKFNSYAVETYGSIAANDVTIFDKNGNFFDRFKNHKDEERGHEHELLITIIKGKYLCNTLAKEGLKLSDCRLKCKFYPDSLKHGPKLKTAYVHCNLKGTSTWKHVFVIKGFSADELASKYVVLEVVAKTDRGKRLVGEVTLGGKGADITRKGSNSIRSPTRNEYCNWNEAIRKPERIVSVTSELLPPPKEGTGSMLADMMLSNKQAPILPRSIEPSPKITNQTFTNLSNKSPPTHINRTSPLHFFGKKKAKK